MNTGESEDEITVKLLAAAATDEILVAAAKLGDRPAFAELWARHSKRSLQIAYRITKNREDAEDVLQEAWTKAYVHLKSFDGKARFSTWLTRIAINTALMTLRRKRVRPETLAEFMDGETWHQLEIPDKTNDVEQQYLRDERVEQFRLHAGEWGSNRRWPALDVILQYRKSPHSLAFLLPRQNHVYYVQEPLFVQF
jgi:RNA polymerase sigma-70 factor (ECF subfamily)